MCTFPPYVNTQTLHKNDTNKLLFFCEKYAEKRNYDVLSLKVIFHEFDFHAA